jgi:hypothetical protein
MITAKEAKDEVARADRVVMDVPDDVFVAEQRVLIDRYVDMLAAETRLKRAEHLAQKVRFFRWQLARMVDGTFPGFSKNPEHFGGP